MPTAVAYGAGAAFVVYATVVFLAAGLEQVRAAGIATMVANLLFTVAAVVVVLARPVDLTTAGVVAVLAGGSTPGVRRSAVPRVAPHAAVSPARACAAGAG